MPENNPYIEQVGGSPFGFTGKRRRVGHYEMAMKLSGRGLTPNVFGEILAREKIYHPKDFDNRVGFLDWLLGTGWGASDINAGIHGRMKAASESKTYLDAMKAWELRKAEPGRYAAFGLEGLGNLDILSEIQGRLQRRNVLGRRRVEEPALVPQGDL